MIICPSTTYRTTKVLLLGACCDCIFTLWCLTPLFLFRGLCVVIKGQGRQVFLWHNKTKTLHAFPNLQTFQAMGFDFDHEMVVTDWQVRVLL